MKLWLLVAYLLTNAHPDYGQYTQEEMGRLVYKESRGNALACNQTSGCTGLMQVQPKYSLYPKFLLYVPLINRMEGTRILHRWLRRCNGDRHCAVRAYACGRAGIRSGNYCKSYADYILETR